MTECKIWLDNYHTGYYFPGSQIQGRICLNFNSETKFKAIKLRLYGNEHTSWKTTEHYRNGHGKKHRRTVVKHGNNNFISSETIVYRTHSGTARLPAGQHIYPFSINLPHDIPGTYNCEYGSISYRLQGIVDRRMAFDYKDELIFIVVTIVDLNKLGTPALLEPASYSKNKNLNCLFWSRGHIEMDVHLPKQTLIPEENVDISVRLSNMAQKDILGLEFKLKQVITCRVDDARESSKSMTNTLLYLKEPGLAAYGQHNYTVPVKLPASCPITNFSLCRLFKVTYYYSIVAKLPGMHRNLKLKIYPQLGHLDIGQVMTGSYPSSIPVGMPMPSVNSSFEAEQGHYSTEDISIGLASSSSTIGSSTSKAVHSAPVHEDPPPPYDDIIHRKKY